MILCTKSRAPSQPFFFAGSDEKHNAGTLFQSISLNDSGTDKDRIVSRSYKKATHTVLLAAHIDVDVIFYQNDNMAVSGYEYCRRQGYEVPRDIGIAGWGDLPIASIHPYRLTFIAVPHLRIGQIAAEMLLARVNQHPIKRTRDVGFKLIPGSTCRMQFKTDSDEIIDHSKK